MSPDVEIVERGDAQAIQAVRELWTAYWESFGLSPEFQGFAEELRALPGKYTPPTGGLLLARINGRPVGTAAFRQLREDACEAKRLFVHPDYRRRGIAASLLARLVDQARRCGYRSLYGDTLPTMASALELYRTMGFVEVGPYSDTPTPEAIYLRLSL